MIVCPICVTNAQKDNQEYCFNCAWEFEYYIDELSQDEKSKYFRKMKIAKSVYDKSNNPIAIEKQKNFDNKVSASFTHQ